MQESGDTNTENKETPTAVKTAEAVNVYCLSDVHLEFGKKFRYNWEIIDPKNNILLLCGDIFKPDSNYHDFFIMTKNTFEYILYIPGNHEYYCNKLFSIEHIENNLKRICDKYKIIYLQKSVWEHPENPKIRIAGCTLWSNIDKISYMAMNDSREIFYSQQQYVNLHLDHYNWLNSLQEPVSIVMTHHLPTKEVIHNDYKNSYFNSGFSSDLDDLIHKLNPLLWCCGHSHKANCVTIGDTKVVLNPVGYPNEHTGYHYKPVLKINY